ncbi:hypothetical protein BGZ60DRAFT_453820 [Tricladium varicosporioides]|nr:hypothetical protein BGZ60DRAFT_453820 [Hymenoscyphus varicosporioides]
MVENKLTQERVGKLLDSLYNLGLKSKLQLAIDHTLEIGLHDEVVTLNPALQTLAFELTGQAISDRIAMDFAEELLKQFRVIAEDEAHHGRRSRHKVAGDGPRSRRESNDAGGHNDECKSSPDPTAHPSRKPYPPQTAEEVFNDLSGFLAKNRSPFRFDSKVLQDMAEKVAAKGREIQEGLGLSDKQLLGLAAVSLYDIVFLCDDSGSMEIGQRIATLIRTLQSVADWATRLEPTGISLRFLNYQNDCNGKFDRLTDLTKIKDMCHLVKPGGGTELGAVIQRKIINRRILEAAQVGTEGLKKPLIVAIITDGEPTDDDRNCFRNTIISCKENKQLALLGEGSTIFILFQVGNSLKAKEYIEEIAEHEDVRDMLYCSSTPLDGVVDALSKALPANGTEHANKYKVYMLDEFIKAIQGEMNDEI